MFLFFKRQNGRNKKGSIIFRRRGKQPFNLYRFIDFFFYLSLKLPYIFCFYLINNFSNSYLVSLIYLNGLFSYRIAIDKIKFNFLYNVYDLHFLNFNGVVNYIFKFEIGKFVCNLPFNLNNKIGLARSSGMCLQILKMDIRLNLALLKMRLKKKYIISLDTLVVYGRVANVSYIDLLIGKAGKNINKGIRPVVRGIARNPVDHPNGGRTPGGKVYRSYSFQIARSSKKTSQSSFRNRYIKSKYIYSFLNNSFLF